MAYMQDFGRLLELYSDFQLAQLSRPVSVLSRTKSETANC
jgi:hypothetical protein